MTDLRDRIGAVVIRPSRHAELRHVLTEQLQSRGPLLDLVIPIFEREFIFQHVLGEQCRGLISVHTVIAFLGFEHEIAKAGFLARNDAAACVVPCNAFAAGNFIGEKFRKPCRIDRRRAAQMDDDLTRFDFGDFRSDECRGIFRAGFLVEFSASIADEAAGECALIEADRKLVAEARQHRFADGFVVGGEINRLEIPTMALGYRAQAVEALRGLSRATREDADLAAALRIEVHRGG